MASASEDLFAAIDAGDVDRVRATLDADPSLAMARDHEGVSALLRARYRRDRALVEAVKARVASLDAFEAATFGDLDRIAVLLAADPDLTGRRSGDGFTAVAPRRVLRAGRRRPPLAGARRGSGRAGHGMDDRDAAQRGGERPPRDRRRAASRSRCGPGRRPAGRLDTAALRRAQRRCSDGRAPALPRRRSERGRRRRPVRRRPGGRER